MSVSSYEETAVSKSRWVYTKNNFGNFGPLGTQMIIFKPEYYWKNFSDCKVGEKVQVSR